MKTIKKVQLELVEVEYIPEEMEFGKFYHSEEFNVSNHLCVCGCGFPTPLRVKPGEWYIQRKNPLTITPSVQQRIGCKSHYIITNGIANIV